MHFEVEHVFDASVEAVEAAMFHPDYASFLLEHSELLDRASLQSFDDDGVVLRRSVEIAPRPAFDKIGTKKIPPEWFVFIEKSTWDRRLRKLSFENVPTTAKIASKVINRGEVTLETQGGGKTRRRARCEIKVHGLSLLLRPFIPVVEQMLSREARRMLDGEAEVLRSWLSKRAAPEVQAQA